MYYIQNMDFTVSSRHHCRHLEFLKLLKGDEVASIDFSIQTY